MKSCWAQYLLWLVIAVLGTGSALSACGQKGALYQPETPTQKERSAASTKSDPSPHNIPSATSVKSEPSP